MRRLQVRFLSGVLSKSTLEELVLTTMNHKKNGMSLSMQRRYLIKAIAYHQSFIEKAYNRMLEIDKALYGDSNNSNKE